MSAAKIATTASAFMQIVNLDVGVEGGNVALSTLRDGHVDHTWLFAPEDARHVAALMVRMASALDGKGGAK